MNQKLWKTTACPYDCPDGCALHGCFDGKAVTLEPNPDLPYSTFLCGKGKRWADRATSSARLSSPLARKEGNLVPVSWEEALDLWAGKIRESVERNGPLSVMYLSSAGSMYFSKKLLPHVFASLGGYTTKIGNLCSSAGSFGLKQTFGEVPVTPPETVEAHSLGVLFWGRNALETHAHVVPVLKKVRERGGEIAALEIRNTPTTRFADRWWRLAPGGDWALAAWLCRRILDGEKDFAGWREHTANPGEFEAAVKGLDSGSLLAAAGLNGEQAEDVYSWLLRFSPVTQYPAFGAQRYLHGDMQFRWIGALAVLLGAFSQKGAGLAFSKDEMALFPSRLSPAPAQVRSLSVSGWPVELEGLEPPVEVLVVSGADPVRQNPASDLVKKAYEKIPFTVCADFILSDTAGASSLVLPITTFLEEEGDWRGSYWHSYLVRSHRVLPPRPGALEETEIYTRLARRLGLDCDLNAMKEEMDLEMRSSPMLEPVGKGVYRWNEPEYWRSGEKRAVLPVRVPEIAKGPAGYLRLVTVHRKEYINGQNWDVPSAAEIPVLSMNPSDAAGRGLKTGDNAVAVNCRGGSLKVRVAEDLSLGSGYSILPQGTRGVNLLTDPLVSPGSGAPFAESWITVEKAGVPVQGGSV